MNEFTEAAEKLIALSDEYAPLAAKYLTNTLTCSREPGPGPKTLFHGDIELKRLHFFFPGSSPETIGKLLKLRLSQLSVTKMPSADEMEPGHQIPRARSQEFNEAEFEEAAKPLRAWAARNLNPVQRHILDRLYLTAVRE